jgi:hypothetical protein
MYDYSSQVYTCILVFLIGYGGVARSIAESYRYGGVPNHIVVLTSVSAKL